MNYASRRSGSERHLQTLQDGKIPARFSPDSKRSGANGTSQEPFQDIKPND